MPWAGSVEGRKKIEDVRALSNVAGCLPDVNDSLKALQRFRREEMF
jgi:hypothetical protein